jgi:SAM-dependent methyltransferase
MKASGTGKALNDNREYGSARLSAEEQFYQNRVDTSVAIQRQAIQKSDRYFHVLAHLAANRPRHCVELGFGGQRYLHALGAVSDRLTVVDIVDRTAGFKAPTFAFVKHNLNEDFPFHTSSFDAVVALMVIEHLFDPFHSLREIARILAPEGWLYLNVPLVTSLKNRLRLLFGQMPLTSRSSWYDLREWDGGHLHYFTVQLLRRLLNENGFTSLLIHPVGRLIPFKRLWPGLLCGEITVIARRADAISRAVP